MALNANDLFNLMMSVEIKAEQEQKRTGKPLKITRRGIVNDYRKLKKKGIL
jgi:type III secretory pathway lipoprotein EscJ